MELFGHTKDVIRANYFYLMERLCPSKISDARDIPIIINNYNRLTMLKKLIDSLTSRGYTNIVILDNQSTYPPLLEWYAECQFEVIRLPKNYGFKALWKYAPAEAFLLRLLHLHRPRCATLARMSCRRGGAHVPYPEMQAKEGV